MPTLDSLKAQIKEDFNRFGSKVKTVYVKLENYKIYHSPSALSEKNEHFHGREKLLKKMTDFILKSKTRSGAYLVTGYRGMGKTSFVREVFNNVDQDRSNKRFLRIELSLAQEELSDMEVLRHIANKLTKVFEADFKKSLLGRLWHFRYLFAGLTLFSLLLYKFACNDLTPGVPLFRNLSQEELNEFLFRLTTISCLLYVGILTLSYLNFEFSASKRTRNTSSFLVHLAIVSIYIVTIYTALLGAYVTAEQISSNKYLKRIYTSPTEIGLNAIENLEAISNEKNLYLEKLSINLVDEDQPIKIEGRVKSNKINNYSYLLIINLITFGIYSLILAAINSFIRVLGTPTIISIYKNSKNLRNKIYNSIHHESSSGISNGAYSLIPFSFINRRIRQEPMHSSKALEYALSDFLKSLHDITPIQSLGYIVPEFIIVFDELDKIEISTAKENIEESEFRNTIEGKSIQKRQAAVATLLSNLKHFLNAAHAKFIFIAGREMFDAALADISDRESFFGSIFHDVIYIPSFYKDTENEDHDVYGITHMFETYLCKIIAPVALPGHNSLKSIFHYLEEDHNYLKLNHSEIDKLLTVLENFIDFLCYRSSGSPKNLINLIENHIEFKDSINVDSNLVLNPYSEEVEEGYYLKFNFEDQHKIGLISYLFRPFMITRASQLRPINDKLLTSLPYLLDHILKFHRHSFSIRNLEMTPELISFNKSPEVRDLMMDLVDFLSHSHLKDSTYGIFEYKFFKKLANELDYISKISEQEGAAFNFTLDESLIVKKHLLEQLEVNNKQIQTLITQNRTEHLHSIAFNYGLLGDLSYFDREYNDAVTYYTNSIQKFSYVEQSLNNGISNVQQTIWNNTEVKLILTLERLGNYEVALEHCQNIMNRASNNKQRTISPNHFQHLTASIQSLYLREKISYLGITRDQVDETLNGLNHFFDASGSIRNSTSSKLRFHFANLLYYRNNQNKTEKWLEDTKYNYEYGLRIIFEKRSSKPFNSCFDIITKLDNTNFSKIKLQEIATTFSFLANLKLLEINKNQLSFNFISNNISTFNILYIRNLLINIDTNNDNEIKLATFIIEKTENPFLHSFTFNLLSGYFFRKSGRLTSYSGQVLKIIYTIKETIYLSINNSDNDEKNKLKNHFNSLITPLAEIHRKMLQIMHLANQATGRVQVLKKELTLSNELPFNTPRRFSKDHFNQITPSADVKEANILWSEILLSIENRNCASYFTYNNCFVSPNSMVNNKLIRLSELIFKVRLNYHELKNLIAEENLRLMINGFQEWDKNSNPRSLLWLQENVGIRQMGFLITDSVFAICEILKYLSIHEVSYIYNYSLKASFQHYLGKWCAIYQGYRYALFNNRIDTRSYKVQFQDIDPLNIVSYIGDGSDFYLDPKYHFERALLSYEKAIEMHNRGKTYYTQINKMSFLEDDFNDNLSHFWTAIERMRINTGTINKQIVTLKNHLEGSRFYNYEYYVNTQ